MNLFKKILGITIISCLACFVIYGVSIMTLYDFLAMILFSLILAAVALALHWCFPVNHK